MAQSLKIPINSKDYINVNQISLEQFVELKSTLSSINNIGFNRRDVSRFWKDSEEKIFLELYNGVAIEVNSKADLKQLKNVNFIRVPYSKILNEISYSVDIEEFTFQKIIEKSKPVKIIEALDFSSFGEFYQIDNTEYLLVKWSEKFQPNSFSILKNNRTVAGIDWELVDYFDNEAAVNKPFGKKKLPNIPIKIEGNTHTNRDDFRQILSEALYLDLAVLDYSVESLIEIETALIWNADILDGLDLVNPFISYVGEILICEKNMKWQFDRNLGYEVLISKNGKILDLGMRLQEGLVETDYGLPQVKWVFDTILDEMK